MPVLTRPHRCWLLVEPDGRLYRGDSGPPHFDTEAEVAQFAAEWADEDDPPGSARQLDTPCVVATCDDCGRPFGSGEWESVHWGDVVAAISAIDSAAGFPVPDDNCFITVGGKIWCMYCRHGLSASESAVTAEATA